MKHSNQNTLSPHLLLFIFLNLLSHNLYSQSTQPDTNWLGDEWYFMSGDSEIFDLAALFPSTIKHELRLKRYLRDDRFYELRKRLGDTLAVDAIFDQAMMLTDGDTRDALLISTFAVMDHRRIGFKVPIFGSVYLPLTFEDDVSFKLRRTHLPKKILDDNRRASDKDKLQHFFGSAFIAYTTNSDSFTEKIGNLFELGEDRFVLGGRNDPRDKQANAKGREFGLRLLKEHNLLPSDVLWGK